jgi:glutamyl-tRNA reductase
VRAAETAADIDRARDRRRGVERFARRRRSERLAPLILALRDRGDEVVASELERFRSDLATLTPDERAAVEALARGVVAKLLHEPIVRMKDRPDPAVQDRLAALLTELFGVEPARE